MSDYDFSFDDIDSMINDASSDFDFSNYFTGGGGESIDLGSINPNAFSFDDIDSMLAGDVDLDAIADLGIGDFDLGNIGSGTDLDALISSMGDQSLEGLEDVELGDALALADMGDFDRLNTYGMTPEQLANRDELMGLGGQDFGSSVDMGKAADDFGANLQSIYDTGGFTSQWQDVDGRKVQVYDDGTGMAINPTTGASRSLSGSEVTSLITSGKLNTAGSGYNTATGGTKIAPGGGSSVVLKDGTTGTLLPTGSVVDGGGTVIGKTTDVAKVVTNTGGGATSTCPSPEMLILLSSGEQKKAGDLQVGDEVKTQHEKTMEWGNFKVTHAEIIPNAKRLSIKLDGKDFICSVDHKFYKDQLWVDAKDIKVGDVLSDKIVTGISEHSTGNVVQITVDDAHTYICEGVLSHNKSPLPPKTTTTTTPRTTTTTPTNTQQGGLGALLPLLLALLAMNKGGGGGGGGGQGAVIPGLTATQRQTPYAQQQRAPGYRPGQGGISYFDQTQYAPKMAAGGGIPGLLYGPGDGVSDSIPAVITDGMSKGGQPAKVGRGEYIFDARSVAALGNGSTDAGAERLDKMRKDILRDDRKAKIGEDSKAYRHLRA